MKHRGRPPRPRPGRVGHSVSVSTQAIAFLVGGAMVAAQLAIVVFR